MNGNQRTESFLSVDKDLKQALCAIVRDELCDEYNSKIKTLVKQHSEEMTQREGLIYAKQAKNNLDRHNIINSMTFFQRLVFLLFKKLPHSLEGK